MFRDEIIARISYIQRFFYFSIEPKKYIVECYLSPFGARKVKAYSPGHVVREDLWKCNEIYICLIEPWKKGYISHFDLREFCNNYGKTMQITEDDNVVRVPNWFWNK